jgi:PAS domain S-box-containing protein
MSAPPPRRLQSDRPLSAILLRYGLSALSVGVAWLLMLGLNELSAGEEVGPALLVAVAVSTLYGGLGPGLVALALAAFLAHDPVVLITGALLAAICAGFRRTPERQPFAPAPDVQEETVPNGTPASPLLTPVRSSKDSGRRSPASLLEVTTEATWRFHHEQPLDITLPEDEQVEHFYLYSVLAECNDAFARMYGFRAAADVVGTRLVVFLPPSNRENVEYLRSFIRSGYRLEDAESHEIDRYGHAKYFVNNLVGIFERGQLVGAWGTQRDVTEEKRAIGSQEYSSRLHSTKSSSQ